MKICLVDYSNLNSGYGTSNWLKEVAARLVLSHEVEIITKSDDTDRADIEMPLIKQKVMVSKIRTISVTSLPRLKSFLYLINCFKISDIVYFIYAPGGLDIALIFLEKLTGTPMIAGHHQPIAPNHFNEYLTIGRTFYYKLFGFRSNRLLKLIKIHHVLNSYSLLNVKAMGAKKAYLIPYGVDTRNFSPRNKPERFRLLFIGRLDPQKGVDILPSLIKELHKRIADFDFYIAGDGQFASLIKDLALKDSFVKYVGFINGNEKKMLYAESHVVVMPSRYEEFGLVGLEAMASGTPIISFNVEGPSEYVMNGINGFIVKQLDEMVEKICEIYHMTNFPSEYQTMVNNCINSAQKYDWDIVIDKLKKMFEECINLTWRHYMVR